MQIFPVLGRAGRASLSGKIALRERVMEIETVER
jgi:hypothetical protein